MVGLDFWLALPIWDWLFWSVVLIDFVWLALPPLVYLLYGSLSTYRVELGMDDVDLPVDPRFGIQLLALGLQPLGAITTRNWLTFNGWNKHVKQYVFGGGDGRYLVLVWITYRGQSPYIRFLSYFKDGHAVATSNEFSGERAFDKYLAIGQVTCNLERLAKVHREKIDELCAAGRPLHSHDSLSPLLNDIRHGPRLPVVMRSQLVGLRLGVCIVMGLISATAYRSYGFDALLGLVGLAFVHFIPLIIWLENRSAVGSQREDMLLADQMANDYSESGAPASAQLTAPKDFGAVAGPDHEKLH